MWRLQVVTYARLLPQMTLIGMRRWFQSSLTIAFMPATKQRVRPTTMSDFQISILCFASLVWQFVFEVVDLLLRICVAFVLCDADLWLAVYI